MRIAERAVYAKLVALLGDRPEAETARARMADAERRAAWAEGEALVLAGEIHAGLARMAGAETRSLRWRIAMPLMRMMPALAAPLLRLRPRLPPPR
jgi:hypothetical protein